MEKRRVQIRIGGLIVAISALAMVTTILDRVYFQRKIASDLILDPSFLTDFLCIILFTWLTLWRSKYAQWGLANLVFLLSAPTILTNGSSSYFGLGIVVIGVLLFQRFEMLNKNFVPKCIAIVIWCAGWIFVADRLNPKISVATSLSVILFLIINLLALYILFEEEIRNLLAANKTKDAALAEQAAEIARLEPLTVLGERVAHVTHSFRNNLNQVGTALFLLEAMHDQERAAEKLREFMATVTDRIDNILMISRAGVDLEPEVFNLERLLEGLEQVYLAERSFVEHAKIELTLNGPVWIEAVRWDIILMVENILKNAIEALISKGIYGTIRIDLDGNKLTLANDGGAIATCVTCHDSCLHCPRYGKPGQTTKVGGTGHGLNQVLGTCRKNKWNFRIRTHEDWTIFEIGFKAP